MQIESRLTVAVFRLAQQPRLRQFVKFCLVGGSGVIVDMTVLHLLVRGLGWNESVSKLCSAEAARLNNFFWNEVWTFRGAGGRRRNTIRITEGKQGTAEASPYPAGVAARLLKFHAICGAGIGLAVFFLHVFYHWLGLNLYATNLLAILLVTLWNFGLNARFNWGAEKAR